MKNLLELFVKNTLFQLLVYGIVLIISGILANWFDLAYAIMVYSAGIIAIYVIIFISAGIINFIKDLFK